jgi:hypothetical protein
MVLSKAVPIISTIGAFVLFSFFVFTIFYIIMIGRQYTKSKKKKEKGGTQLDEIWGRVKNIPVPETPKRITNLAQFILQNDPRVVEINKTFLARQHLMESTFLAAQMASKKIHVIVPVTNPVKGDEVDVDMEHIVVSLPDNEGFESREMNVLEVPLGAYLVLKDYFEVLLRDDHYNRRTDYISRFVTGCHLSAFK